MPDLIERTKRTESAEEPAGGRSMRAPPGMPPLDAEQSPTGWPNRAKLLVVVLLIATVLGAIGTAIGFVSANDRSDEINQLEREVTSLTDERDGVSATMDVLEADVAQLEADLAEETQLAAANAAESARQVADLESTVADLESTVADLESTEANLRSAVATLTSDRDDALAIIGQLETDLINGVVFAGQGIEVATAYPSEQSIHPIAMVGDGAQGAVAQQLPPSWTAGNVFETELVVDIGDSEQAVIEECPYNGPNITRYRYSTTVSVYSATAGQRIADVTLTGADPRACRQQEPWDLTELHGAEVTANQVISWLEGHVVSGG